MKTNTTQVVFTNKARCRDCYRCIRVCPVKAIKMSAGQAYVIEDLCIGCGTCIRECPQKAKTYRNDIEKANSILKENPGKVFASIAPAFAASFSGWQSLRLPGALRRLGFDKICETAAGAAITALKTSEYIQSEGNARSYICSPCPAAVSLAEKYIPDSVKYLVPVVSPMIAHAKMLKEKMPDSKIIFIGPCIAKKIEIQRPGYENLIDCALTFEELKTWLENEKIDIARCEETGFDYAYEGAGRYFPLNGGIIQCSGAGENRDLPVLTVSGEYEVKEAVGYLRDSDTPALIDPLFCSQGCINGPAIGTDKNIFERRQDILNYAAHKNISLADAAPEENRNNIDFHTDFLPAQKKIIPEESQIRSILERTGKELPENQLNCGACGYPSCREKAIAVINGLAEEDMCIPLMRRRAEQKSDLILEYSPNGMVLLDDKLHILNMNKAFRKFFMAGDAIIGKHISYLIDPGGFEQLAGGMSELIEGIMNIDKYGLVCHYLLYSLKEIGQYVGIFVNITTTNTAMEKLSSIKKETVELARTLLSHELEAAQKYAALLGENTAKTESLVNKLMLISNEN